MRRRTFLSLAAAAAVKPAQAATRPNVIIVLVDDQGYGDLSAHGNPVLKTPNLDRWHATSTRFTDFHVTPMCTPTRGQLMTGRNALSNRAMNVSSGRALLRTDIPTMADVFRSAGYRTGQFGKWHLGDTYPYRPQDRGFEESVWFPSSHVGSAGDYWDNDYFNDTYRHNGKQERFEGYCTDVFFGQAMQWIRARAAAHEPFFVYLPTNAPHGPLFVPDKYKAMYPGLTPQASAFFGMLANLDENAGKLEQMLADTGLRDNTILIYMTDNGGTAGVATFNAGMRGQKISYYEGGHRVPCFIRWPGGGVQAGRDVGELTCIQDILPTLAELCDLKVPDAANLDGTSLAKILRKPDANVDRTVADRTVIVQFSRMNKPRPQKGDACVMWRKWRLVEDRELYDIGKDPAQKSNVIDAQPEIAARLRAYYGKWWEKVEPALDSFLPVHIGAPQENPVQISPTEWADSFLDQGVQVRAALHANGIWHIDVERAGDYEFTLSRWPKEAGAAMRAGLPPHKGECGQYPAGVAMPIAKVALEIAGNKQSHPVGADDREVVFRLPLRKGRTTLKTWFYDEAGAELSGAYFVYARYTS